MRTIILFMIGVGVLAANFTKNVNCVTDSNTGLQWQDDKIVGPMTWEESLDYCEALSLDDHIDWRLPNVRELISIIDESKYNPSINPVFENIVSKSYWSSTSSAGDTNSAYHVYFYNGSGSYISKNKSIYVRCVREGK